MEKSNPRRKQSASALAQRDEMRAGEQDWYSDWSRVNRQVGMSTLATAALIVAEKLDLTKVLSSILFSPLNK
jgi:hypothetical protein